MKYQVTFTKSKLTPCPTDYLHVPAWAELIDQNCIKNTSRSEVWVFEYNEKKEHSGAIERAFQECRTVSSFKELL